MSWCYLPAPVAAHLGRNISSAGDRLATSSGTTIAVRSRGRGSKTGSSRRRRCSVSTSATSSASALRSCIAAWLKRFRRGAPASRSRSRDPGTAKTTRGTCGLPRSDAFASFDRGSASWRTSPRFDALDGRRITPRRRRPVTSGEWLATWPRAGIAFGGTAYLLPPSARLTGGTGSGSWPTPVVGDATGGRTSKGRHRPDECGLAKAVTSWPTPRCCSGKRSSGANRTEFYRRMFPTPRKTDAERGGRGDLLASIRGYPTQRAHWPTPKASASGPDYAKATRPGAGGDDLVTAIAREERGGQLNPAWTEWLMGWPVEWTNLEPLSGDAVAAWRDAKQWWRAEPRDVPRVARNVPRRVDRLKALGNGQVPACVALAWRLLGRAA